MGKSQPPDEHFEALIEAARAAEPWAVGELWRRYQPRLRGYIGTLEPGAADDICSETWISVGRSLPRFRGAEPDFRSWLFTIAHRRLCDHRRRTGRSQILLAAAGDSDGAEPVCSAESDALEREGTRRALALIAALPPDQAQVVLLRTLAGLDSDRVAAVVGKRPGTVRVLAHRGLRNLAKRLDGARLSMPADEPAARRPGA
ncbi:MAG TPA: RNA polymerase sigma factor [Acidimicrobiales bacterium]|nr:RNA polymerase sigma factor [Acidimicrobiales bacterium]